MSDVMAGVIKKLNGFSNVLAALLCAAVMTQALPVGPVTGKFLSILLIFYILWKGEFLRYSLIFRLIASVVSILAVNYLELQSQLAVLVFICLMGSFYNEERHHIYRALIQAQILFFIFLTAEQSFEAARRAENFAAEIISRLGGGIIGRCISIGPTYSGLHLIILFSGYLIPLLFTYRRNLTIRFNTTIVSMVLGCWIIYLSVWSILSEIPVYDHLSRFEPLISVFDYRVILFIFLLVPVSLTHMKLTSLPQVCVNKNAASIFFNSKHAAVYALLFFLPVLLVFGLEYKQTATCTVNNDITRNITIYSSEKSPVIMDKPEFGKLGIENVGMFGLLPEYLTSAGYTVNFTDSPDFTVLKDTDVLVIINLMERLDSKYQQAIWEYVGKGGALLVLGDHTGTSQIREPFNELLKPVGISFNFDSAIPFHDLWRQSYTFARHPVLKNLNWHDIQINIGASLNVTYPAHTLISGKYGYSDSGDLNNYKDGYLGDMAFNRGERLGDIVLAAEAYYKKGKVVAFGDTSLLQVVNLPYSYHFVNRLFSWLLKPRSTILELAAILLLSSAAFVLAYLNRHVTVIAAVSLLIAAAVLAQLLPFTATETAFEGKLVAVDATSSNLIKVTRDKQSVDALMANIERNGYLPFLIKDKKDLNRYKFKALVEIAPAVPLIDSKIDFFKEYMKTGGTIIMSVGWREYYASKKLLDEFGLELCNIPLGRGDQSSSSYSPSFWEAWPLSLRNPDRTKVLSRVWNYPVVTYSSYGKGGFLFIGDSQFFSGKNLEDLNFYNTENINFIEKIFKEYVKK